MIDNFYYYYYFFSLSLMHVIVFQITYLFGFDSVQYFIVTLFYISTIS